MSLLVQPHFSLALLLILLPGRLTSYSLPRELDKVCMIENQYAKCPTCTQKRMVSRTSNLCSILDKTMGRGQLPPFLASPTSTLLPLMNQYKPDKDDPNNGQGL